MPQALATWLVSIGVSALAAQVIAAVVTIAITIGLQSIFGPSRPKPSDGQQEVRTSVGSRFAARGIVHSSGQLTFEKSANGTLAKVVTTGTGKVSQILEHRINDQPVTVAGGTVTNASFRGAVHIYTRDGSDDQTAIGELTAKFPEWTANHRQLGCSHAAIICDPVEQKYFSEVYNSRVPEYSSVRKEGVVYDPRQDDTAIIGYDLGGAPIHGAGPQRLADRSTWAWRDNGPLVTADYFAHEDGYGAGYDTVNWTNIAQEAEIADQLVLTITGENIARYRIWARWGLSSEERRAVLTSMLQAIDGFSWQDADGKFNLVCGRWIEPEIVLTDDHILGLSAKLGPEAIQSTSSLKVLYTEAAIGYKEQESATITVPGSAEDPNTAPQAVQAYYIPHHNQAARIGKLLAAELSDERWHIAPLLNLYGLNLLGERFCRVESEALGVSAYFKIEGLKLHLAADPPKVEVTGLVEVRPEDWDFDAAAEEGTPPNGTVIAPPVVTIPVPTGLTLAAEQIAFGDANGVAIAASWDDPGRAGFTWQVQYRPSAGGDWVDMAVDNDQRTARSGPVDSGTEYEVRIRAVTITGRVSDWSAAATITPAATTTLGAPTALAATGGAAAADVSFSMPTSASVAFARLYHSASNDFGTATQVGGDIAAAPGVGVTVHDAGLSAGTEYYWARAFDGSGGQSALTGPASATIT